MYFGFAFLALPLDLVKDDSEAMEAAAVFDGVLSPAVELVWDEDSSPLPPAPAFSGMRKSSGTVGEMIGFGLLTLCSLETSVVNTAATGAVFKAVVAAVPFFLVAAAAGTVLVGEEAVLRGISLGGDLGEVAGEEPLTTS